MPEIRFEEGLSKTVAWYLTNRRWWENVLSRGYQPIRVGKAIGAP
jgi:dTDP-glucose 4,6-dehydratase